MLTLFAPITFANPAAVSWLAAQQQADGSYQRQDDIATPVQATAETLRALQVLNSGNGVAPAAYTFLDTAAGQPVTEYLARTLIAHSEAGSSNAGLLAALESRQNPDGGFGGAPGFAGNALDTAYALEALAKTAGSHEALLSAAVKFLIAQQNADGSYTQNNDGQGAIYTTAAALIALHPVRLRYDLTQPINKAAAYLLSNRDNGGGWGSDFETAWALLALAPSTTDTAPLTEAAQLLKNTQLSDGSWDEDVYRTALATRALQAVQDGPSAPPSWTGTVTGRVLEQGSGLPLAGVAVFIDGDQANFTDADGAFRLQGIAPGTHPIRLTLTGYAEAVRTGVIDAGQPADLGIISLSALADRSIVTGIVTDAANGQALSGASVALAGATAITDAAGAYRLVATPGVFPITVSAPGFQDVTVTATLAAGATLTFSPGLLTASGSPPTTTELTGIVVDANTGLALADVDVALSGSALKTVTDAVGGFSLKDLTPGALALDLTLAGYQSAHVTLTVAAGTSHLGTLRLPSLTGSGNDGIVTGSVTDAAHGTPLAGAHVKLSGTGTLEAVTNALGAYRLIAPAGTYTLSASAPGFQNAVASATLAAGTTLNFAPGLLADTASVPTTTRLLGSVVDASTGLSLADVDIAVSDNAISAVTDADGQFTLAELSPGSWMLNLSLAGYQSLQVTLSAPAGSSDLGTLRLSPVAANGNTLTGIVTDSATGAPLAGALLAIDSTGQSRRTAADGSYRLEGLGPTRYSVTVSAVGYLSRQGEVNLALTELSTLNVALERAATAHFDIDSLLPTQSQYPAHSRIDVNTHLVNKAANERKVQLYGVIKDADGQIVKQFPARIVPLNGNPADALETVPANGAADAVVTWLNGAQAPGRYNVIVQAYDSATGKLLAERSTPVEIIVTRAIGGSVQFDPPIAQLAAQQPVSLTARISNRGNLDLAGGTVTAKVTLKNTGYQNSNAPLEVLTLVQENDLKNPRGIDRDDIGNFYVVNGRSLSQIDKSGAIIEIESGLIAPIDVDVTPDGDIHILTASGTYERLSLIDGILKKINVNMSVQTIEALSDGRVLIGTATQGVWEITPTGKNKLPLTGVSNVKAIQSDAQGRVYIGDNTSGTIFRLVGSNALETIQTNLPSLGAFAIAADGNIAAVYDSGKKLAVFAPDGSRHDITNVLPATVQGCVWDADGGIVLSVGSPSIGSSSPLIKLLNATTPSNIDAGKVVYSHTITLPPLDLNAVAVPLDFGTWTPSLSGDFQAELTVDTHAEYGVLLNTLHVGPNAHGDITVSETTVRPGDRTNQATINLFGADSTSITRIDPNGTTLAAVSKTTGRAIVADTYGNIYATNASASDTVPSIVRFNNNDTISVILSGYQFGTETKLAIDAQNNLFFNVRNGINMILPIF